MNTAVNYHSNITIALSIEFTFIIKYSSIIPTKNTLIYNHPIYKQAY